MTEHILTFYKETGTRVSGSFELLGWEQMTALKEYVISHEAENERFKTMPIGHQVRAMHTFMGHEMTNGQKMNILAEYVVRKGGDEGDYLECINVFITDEEMPDLFLDIVNFHRQTGSKLKEP